MHTRGLSRPDGRLCNAQCQNSGQRCERKQSREPGESTGTFRQDRCPPEAQREKQEPRPRLVESQKDGQPARVESPYGGKTRKPDMVGHMTTFEAFAVRQTLSSTPRAAPMLGDVKTLAYQIRLAPSVSC